MDNLWLWLVIIGAIWLFWPRKKTAPPQATFQPPEQPAPKKELEGDDLEVAAARRARDQAEREERAALDQHHKSMESIRKKLEKARKYMEETGLDRSIPAVWEMVRYWPHWVKLPDRWTPPEGVTAIAGSGDRKDEHAEFEWKNRSYAMHFVEKHNYVPDDYDRLGEITLTIDGLSVCTIRCSHGIESYDDWRFTGVEALKVGPWMTDFVALASHLRSEQEATSRKFFSDIERERADRIDLGE